MATWTKRTQTHFNSHWYIYVYFLGTSKGNQGSDQNYSKKWIFKNRLIWWRWRWRWELHIYFTSAYNVFYVCNGNQKLNFHMKNLWWERACVWYQWNTKLSLRHKVFKKMYPYNCIQIFSKFGGMFFQDFWYCRDFEMF